ncbi:MAG: chromate transporter [Eubacteriaceae bacterium]|nr:chromate transporter [Eubacteriaceae bacterium]
MILLELFYVFFTIGLFTFGGGYAMIPLLQQEITARGWVDEATVIDFIAVSESTPGPFAINMATFVGNKMAGIPGCICAVAGMVVPSFVIILIVARFFQGFADNPYVTNVFRYLRPVVLGLISYAALNIITKTVIVYENGAANINIWAVAITAVIFLISRKLKNIHPIVLIMISAVMGVVLYGFVV